MLWLNALARSIDVGPDTRLAQWAHGEVTALEAPQVSDELAQVWLEPDQ